jgi:hypothetical protein
MQSAFCLDSCMAHTLRFVAVAHFRAILAGCSRLAWSWKQRTARRSSGYNPHDWMELQLPNADCLFSNSSLLTASNASPHSFRPPDFLNGYLKFLRSLRTSLCATTSTPPGEYHDDGVYGVYIHIFHVIGIITIGSTPLTPFHKMKLVEKAASYYRDPATEWQ